MNDDLTRLIEDISNLGDPENSCFLCGQSPPAVILTKEHVIPLWAQKRYDLLDQRLILLNQTSVPYRQLTVPCCEKCNKERLKPIEDAMATTVDVGRDAVEKLGEQVLFLWLGKILYGLLYKQMSFMIERARPERGAILDSEFVGTYYSHRFLLQQAGNCIRPVNFSPGSIYVFDMQPLPNCALQWDFCDGVQTLFVGCRVGRVGLIAVLGDGGAQLTVAGHYESIRGLKLHPIQFRELCAQFCYRSLLFNRTPKYITIGGTPHQTFQAPLRGFLDTPLFDNWVPKDYATILSQFTQVELEHLYKSPDAVWSWLYDDSGNLNFIDFNTHPW